MRKVTIDPDKIPQNSDLSKYSRKIVFNIAGKGYLGSVGGVAAADILLTGGIGMGAILFYTFTVGMIAPGFAITRMEKYSGRLGALYNANGKINSDHEALIYNLIQERVFKHFTDETTPQEQWEQELYALLGNAQALDKHKIKDSEGNILAENGLLYFTEKPKSGAPIDMSRVINVRGEPQAPGNPYITVVQKAKPMAAYKPLGY